MRSPLVQLLTARRFAPLFVTQFLGAFNDNLLKSALGIVVTFRLAEQSGMGAASLVMLAGALFIAPFFLFSGASGTLADRIDKSSIARWVKVAEIGIMALGAWGLWQQSCRCSSRRSSASARTRPSSARSNTRCCHSTCARTNSSQATRSSRPARSWRFCSARSSAAASCCSATARSSSAAAASPARSSAGSPHVRFRPRRRPSGRCAAPAPSARHDRRRAARHVPAGALAADSRGLVVLAVRRDRRLGSAVLAKDVLFANEQVVTMMLALFAVGVGGGSMLAERLLHGEVSARYVPVGGRGMAVFAFDLPVASAGRPPTAELANVSTFLASRAAGASSPISLAWRSPAASSPYRSTRSCSTRASRAHRARVIAANNIINALAMSVAAVAAAAFLARGMTMGELFGLCGVATIPVTLVAAWILRRSSRRAWCGSSCGCSIASRSRASSTRERPCRTR